MNGDAGDALDILANAVQRLEEIDRTNAPPTPSEHRVSCHRCGNIRKKKLCCPRTDCPHIFCGRCADKLRIEHGEAIFDGGCPVCKEMCCCSNKTIYCDRKNHCYRKCPSTKSKLYHQSMAQQNQHQHHPQPSEVTYNECPSSSSATNSSTAAAAAAARAWDQDAKNCRAPALDFLASIVSNDGPETDDTTSPAVAFNVGICTDKDINSSDSMMKSESTKSLASIGTVISSVGEFELNSNGKRTPVDATEFESNPQKQLKVGEETRISSKPGANEIPAATASNFSVANLPMPNTQIPHLNNGQFNQISETGNTQNLGLGNSASVSSDAVQFTYYFAGMKEGSATEQQSLVFPVSGFSANSPTEGEDNNKMETVTPTPVVDDSRVRC